jgi:hypothetical protein
MEVDMNHTGGLRILTRRGALTETNWFDLLEERRILIEPYLREMTLKTLGDLKIVHQELYGQATRCPLRMGAMIEKTYCDPPYRKYREAAELTGVEGDFPLDTRGIYPDDDGVYYYRHFKTNGCVIRFWGLTRNSEWINAECTVRRFEQARHAGHDERLDRRSEVVKFIVSASTPQDICQFCGITPQWVWQRLGDTVEAWLKHRQLLLARVEQLVKVIDHEKLMVNIIAQK